MRNHLFYNQLIVRLVGPLPLGILVYVLVLLLFDDLSALGQLFFNQELLLCIVTTYLFSEIQRLISNSFLGKIESSDTLKLWFSALLIAGLASSAMLVFGVISSYFIWAIGYSFGTFSTELTIFLSLYGFIYLLYFMVLLSVILFRIESKRTLEKESLLKKNIDLKMKIFSRVINPEFLYQSLETLISILYRKDKSAESFIQKLSHVYRSVLDSRHEDLATLDSEIAIAESVTYLYNQQYNGHINWIKDLDQSSEELFLLPGSMMVTLEWIVNSNMINPGKPLKIQVRVEDDYLVVEYSMWEKLMLPGMNKEKLLELVQSFEHFTQRPLLIIRANEQGFVKIPLLKLETAA